MKRLLSIAMLMTFLASCEKREGAEPAYEVNSTTSVAEWEGHAPDHSNTGSFAVEGSLIATPNGLIKSGSFVIPISSIKNYNLPDEVKPQLLEHLKSPDFFNMALHPNAAFKITKVQPYTKGEGIPGANYLITGDFTMIGQTHAISFPAKVSYTTDSLKAEATFQLDRTKWGMNSYTDANQGLYIRPNVDMRLRIAAGRKQ